MTDPDPTEEIEQQFDQLYADGRYAEALEIVTRGAHLFPEHAQKVVLAWQMDLALRLSNPSLAIRFLEEAVRRGYWYHGLAEDPDYAPLRSFAQFEALVAACEQRRAKAMAEAVPVVKTYLPGHTQPPYPMLMALHGASSTAEADHWSAAVEAGWFLALPQSSQVYSPGTFTWNDWDWALQEVPQRYASLCADYPVDANRVVLAGFSQGGGLAAWLALSRRIPVCGLILVGPFLPSSNRLKTLLMEGAPAGLRVYLVAGEKDRYCYHLAHELRDLFSQFGIPSTLQAYPDLEHAFPLDFEQKLPFALNWVMGESGTR